MKKELQKITQDLTDGLITNNEARALLLVLLGVSNSFGHEIIEKIRNSKSDAEARRYIKQHIKNCC
jgi:hypothetical protein